MFSANLWRAYIILTLFASPKYPILSRAPFCFPSCSGGGAAAPCCGRSQLAALQLLATIPAACPVLPLVVVGLHREPDQRTADKLPPKLWVCPESFRVFLSYILKEICNRWCC